MQPNVGPERLAQAAFWYYVQDMTQDEVARRLGVSRSNVSRMLRGAREQGIVRFDVRYPLSRDPELEGLLLDRYRNEGVREVVVAASPRAGASTADESAAVPAVARAAADWFTANLQPGTTLALSWGGTIQTMVDVAYFPRKVDAHVVQLAGETSLDPRHSGHDLVRDLANKLGGRYSYFNAPAFAPSAEAAKALLSSPQVARALEVAKSADVAVLGIGAYDAGTSRLFLDQAKVTDDERREAEREGAVGQICGRFFNRHGRQLDLELHRRILSVDIEDLQAIPTVVVAASGAGKREAVAAALLGGLIQVLVVDHALARALGSGPAYDAVS